MAKEISVEQSTVIVLILKACLQSAQLGRDMSGTIFDTILVKKDQPEATLMTEEGKKYASAVKADKNHDLGAPHI